MKREGKEHPTFDEIVLVACAPTYMSINCLNRLAHTYCFRLNSYFYSYTSLKTCFFG